MYSHGVLTTSEDLAAHMHGSLQLRYVHILARHGARTTVVELPNAVGNLPGSNDNKQPLCTPADLTVNELRQFHIHKVCLCVCVHAGVCVCAVVRAALV